MVEYIGLGDWLREFERQYAMTFRTVAMGAIGITVGSPTLGSPHSLRRQARATHFRGWRPSHIGYIMGNTFRPAAAEDIGGGRGAYVVSGVGFVVGSPAIGTPTLDAFRTLAEFTRRHRWRPVFVGGE